jgi:hypothetical protein
VVLPSSDDLKEAIFHRYEQGKRGVGEGPGICPAQIPVERYGGKDPVPGRPGEGAAFVRRFNMRRNLFGKPFERLFL